MIRIETLANSHVCHSIKRISSLFILFAISACVNNTSIPQNWFFGEWQDVNDSDYTVKITEDNICINGRLFSWIYSSEDELYIGKIEGGDSWEMDMGATLWEDEESIFVENRELKRIGRKPKKPANNIKYSNEQDYSKIYGTWVSQDSPSQVLIIKKNTIYDCNQEIEYNCDFRGNVLNILADSPLPYEIGDNTFYGYDYSITDYQGIVFTKRSDSVRYPRTRAQKMKDSISGKDFSHTDQLTSMLSIVQTLSFNEDGSGVCRTGKATMSGVRYTERDYFKWEVFDDKIRMVMDGETMWFAIEKFAWGEISLISSSNTVYRQD